MKQHLRSGTALNFVTTQTDHDRARAYRFLYRNYPSIGLRLCEAVMETFSHFNGESFHFETEDLGDDMDALSAFNHLKPRKKAVRGPNGPETGLPLFYTRTVMDAAKHEFTIVEPNGDEPGKVKLEMWRVGL